MLSVKRTLNVLIPDIGMVLDVPYYPEFSLVSTFLMNLADAAERMYSSKHYPPLVLNTPITSRYTFKEFLIYADLVLGDLYRFSDETPMAYVASMVQLHPSEKLMLKLLDEESSLQQVTTPV